MKPGEILERCFTVLPANNLRNLLWHVNNGSKVCCGRRAYLWATIGGG